MKFAFVRKMNHIDESHHCDKITGFDENSMLLKKSSILAKFNIVMTIEYNDCRLLMKSHHFDENLSLL